MAKKGITGDVHIANDVIADLAGFAALECYGIVGMASPNLREGVAQLLSRDKLRKGVTIAGDDEGVKIDLFVVMEHGTNLSQVASNLVDRVKYVVQTYAGVQIAGVQVHVQGIKVHD